MDLMGDFEGTFPFEPRFIEIGGSRIHYVDEGQGPPVVLFHGNPTWSYEYREVIPRLAAAGMRALAYDKLGFGRSDKPWDARYVLETHIETARELVETLDLRDATFVMRDWGGPIGCGAALRLGDRVRRLVVMNTWAWVLPEGAEPPFLQQFRTRGLGELLQLAGNLFVESIPGGIHRKDLAPVVMEAYRAPFPDYSSRVGVLQFPRDIPFGHQERSSATMEAITKGLRESSFDVLIIWGMEDRIFPPLLMEFWREIFPSAHTIEIEGAAHYLTEDAPEEIAAAIIEFAGSAIVS